ncbi:uroporphyrinogen decarboxylase [Glycomyces harbinensis]|uniref:Uroporphyrinogen decarboxylase n=1 Tax=Glycomyces harbinensis TaxID=58114 RepID=A0A1G6U300_9ACTN|nr:uroporphyrinogen decarboxylase [Glycomyces harbinensis]SDD35772.1 uroporphyrinogen decarboxylase [Glycomyces harbinensis]
MSQSPFLAACRGEEPSRTPVWFMRQAGRSLPEYKEARAGTSMLEACRTPELVAEITMQPVRRYGVDAAIFFSDIVVPIAAIGVDIEIVPGTGPVVAEPFRTEDDVKRLRNLDPCDVTYITEAIGLLVKDLGDTPLIGFAGAPFTLASYLIEGGPSRDHAKTKALMHSAPEVWHGIASRLAAICGEFLRVQVEAGAQAVQLFDSWAGALSEADYRRFALPHSTAALAGVAQSVPRIHFGVGTGHLLEAMTETGAEVSGVDFRIPLDQAAKRLPDKVLQGNLDPALILADDAALLAETDAVLDAAQSAKGHIFNLGHGVLPDSDPEKLKLVVDRVHERTGHERTGGEAARR